ncbi:phosphatase PAP2 family protein [uncultured Fibrella sp.]|uniref:phosphatase PAP2 family protein n=1 Tax=uncultured Fibrella sp. TaxID=1284596 RepID=UPI0035CCA0C0
MLTSWMMLCWLSLATLIPSIGQSIREVPLRVQWDSMPARPATFRWVMPAVLIPAGVSLSPDYPNSHFDRFYVRSELQDKLHFRTHADDFLQYGPMAVWTGLSLAGVKGRSLPLDRAGIALMAHGIMSVVVLGLKEATHEGRPDGSDSFSFPSGHTALAFTGAGLLDREFGGASSLIPIGGYAMAATTGLLRMTNDKHWISDVLVGAGIGLLSSEIAYQVYPWLKRKIVRHKSKDF